MVCNINNHSSTRFAGWSHNLHEDRPNAFFVPRQVLSRTILLSRYSAELPPGVDLTLSTLLFTLPFPTVPCSAAGHTLLTVSSIWLRLHPAALFRSHVIVSCDRFVASRVAFKSHSSRSSDVPSAGRSQFIVTCDLQASPQPREPRSFRFLVAVHHGLRPKSHPNRSRARWTFCRVAISSSPGRSDSAPNRFPCHLPFAAASLDRTTQNRDWTVC
jgi:hypothetical protein